MTYTDFAEKLLIALYQESEVGHASQTFEAVLSRYGFAKNLKWLERLSDEWRSNGFVDVEVFIGSPLKWYAEIAGPGVRYIEGKYGSKDGVGNMLEPLPDLPSGQVFLTDQDGALLQDSDGSYLVDEGAVGDATSPQLAVQSSSWTGLPNDYEFTELRQTALRAAISRAERDLDAFGASNAEKSQARAYIIAIRALSEAPEPPADVIWALLNKAATIATIAQLFLPLIQAFMH